MQQINLYLPELRPQTDYLSAGKCLAGVAALCLALVAVSISAVMEESRLSAELEAAQTKYEQIDADLKKLKQQPESPAKKQLERQIEAARAGLINRQRLAGVLQGETLGNSRGFSGQVRALSDFVPQGISLHYFALNAGGRQLHLSGQSLQADTIAAFLSQLRLQQAFAGTQFGELRVQDEKGGFSFSLAESVTHKRTTQVPMFRVN